MHDHSVVGVVSSYVPSVVSVRPCVPTVLKVLGAVRPQCCKCWVLCAHSVVGVVCHQ